MGHWQQHAGVSPSGILLPQDSLPRRQPALFADGALAPERAPASQSDTFAVQLAATNLCRPNCNALQ